MTQFEEIMSNRLGESWFRILQEDINSPWFQNIATWLATERKSRIIYPDSNDVFRAFKLSPFEKTKVVILGLDPYTDGTANGLAFGYRDGIKPDGRLKSLDIIFQELEDDVKFGLYLDQDYDLEWLAEQGVLLLNTVLTTERGKTKSHADAKKIGWQRFTGKAIAHLYANEIPKVFMLWGNDAEELFWYVIDFFKIQNKYHLVLKAKHPAYDVRQADSFRQVKPDYPNTFLGCKHFSKCNEFLERNYQTGIIW
jgi:uracil-DNA glycosylase